MYIDFAIAFIFLICIIVGDRRGFVKTFIGTFGWIFAMGGAWILHNNFIRILDSGTTIRNDINSKIIEIIKFQLMKKAANIPDDEELPGSIASALTRAADRAVTTQAENAAAPIADILVGVLAFLIIFALIKFILFFIQHLLIKLTSEGPLKPADSLGGIICGVIKAVVISYILILIVSFVAVVGNIPAMNEQVTNSVVIGFLYNFGLTPFTKPLTTILGM